MSPSSRMADLSASFRSATWSNTGWANWIRKSECGASYSRHDRRWPRRSVERLAVAPQRNQYGGGEKRRQRPGVNQYFGRPVALQHYSADDTQEMRQRQDFAQRLRPPGHAAKRKHEPREQDRRQEEEHRHLHRLKLVLRHGREGEPDAEVGGYEEDHRRRQQREASLVRHTEDEARRQQYDDHLHIADDDVRQDLAEHDLDRSYRHRQQRLHRAAL